MPDSNLALTAEHTEALRNYELLRESLPKLLEEKEHLIHHTLPHLQATYLSKTGRLKFELLEVRFDVLRLKRKMEMIQAKMNRGEEVIPEVIDALVELEMRAQREKLDGEARKLEAAMKFMNAPPLTEEENRQFRKLYHKLAMKLHPDMNPGQNDKARTLWLRLAEAYRNGDLREMQLIEVLLETEKDPGDRLPTALEELKKKIYFFFFPDTSRRCCRKSRKSKNSFLTCFAKSWATKNGSNQKTALR